MKFISWNLNGIRACVQKGFMDFFQEADADIFCIQETKMQEGQLVLDIPGYHQYWNYAVKKGYSGYFYPDVEGVYSWWSYRFSARAKNAGWRIDYFCVSQCLNDRLEDAKILTDVMGSDHCPVVLEMK